VVARVQQALPSILRALALLALLAGLALALVVALVYWQGERSEVRRVDALVLLPTTAQLQSAAFNYAQTLYRQGQAPVLILAAEEDSDLDTQARQANIPEEDVLLAEAEAASRAAYLRAVAELARGEGIQSVLLVSHPDQLLLDLKIAGDAGLEAYGAPPPGSERDFPTMVQASLDYWNYVLLGG
jgi:uncharacterized SAM-binding protein YcdF (DUF218 family)